MTIPWTKHVTKSHLDIEASDSVPEFHLRGGGGANLTLNSNNIAMERFYVVSLESGQLLLKAGCEGGDDETRSIYHSLKLYAIFCQMRAISAAEKGAPFWIRSGTSGITFSEDYHQFQTDGQIRQVSAVFILCTRPEVEFEEATEYFESLKEVYAKHVGSSSDQLEACQVLITGSLTNAKESQKKLKGSIALDKIRAALTET